MPRAVKVPLFARISFYVEEGSWTRNAYRVQAVLDFIVSYEVECSFLHEEGRRAHDLVVGGCSRNDNMLNEKFGV